MFVGGHIHWHRKICRYLNSVPVRDWDRVPGPKDREKVGPGTGTGTGKPGKSRSWDRKKLGTK